jgi:hypothetical protein
LNPIAQSRPRFVGTTQVDETHPERSSRVDHMINQSTRVLTPKFVALCNRHRGQASH